MAGATLLAALLALPPGQAPEPPPLTEEQRAQITRLANETQKEAARLKGLLEARQQELARAYAEYELDEKRAAKLEEEILDLQRQMLANYRKMQVELRALVGKERFLVLKKRIDNLLQVPAPKAPKDERPPGP